MLNLFKEEIDDDVVCHLDGLLLQRVTTAVRIRPLSKIELKTKSKASIIPDPLNPNNLITINPQYFHYSEKKQSLLSSRGLHERRFQFDHLFWSHDKASGASYTGQQEVFDACCKPLVKHCINGLNCTIICYGQTGSGKTYTMFGEDNSSGLVHRLCREVLDSIKEFPPSPPNLSDDSAAASDSPSTSTTTCDVRQVQLSVSYYEIYNDRVYDLLTSNKAATSNDTVTCPCRVRENPQDGAYIENLTSREIKSIEDIALLLKDGMKHRSSAETLLNTNSSRSHAILTFTLKQDLTIKVTKNADSSSMFNDNRQEENVSKTTSDVFINRISKVNLVDLAGSERASLTGVTGARLREANCINKSLLTLGQIITALADRRSSLSSIHKSAANSNNSITVQFLPYRNSTLTWLLKDSLGGNCKTTIIANISPGDKSYAESLNTLKFLENAKFVSTMAIPNDAIDEALRVANFQQEIIALQQQHAQRDGEINTIGSRLDNDIKSNSCDSLRIRDGNEITKQPDFIASLSDQVITVCNDSEQSSEELEKLKALNRDQEEIIDAFENAYLNAMGDLAEFHDIDDSNISNKTILSSGMNRLILSYKREITEARNDYSRLLEAMELLDREYQESKVCSIQLQDECDQLKHKNIILQEDAVRDRFDLQELRRDNAYLRSVLQLEESQSSSTTGDFLSAAADLSLQMAFKERDLLKKLLNKRFDIVNSEVDSLTSSNLQLAKQLKEKEQLYESVVREKVNLEASLSSEKIVNRALEDSRIKQQLVIDSLSMQVNHVLSSSAIHIVTSTSPKSSSTLTSLPGTPLYSNLYNVESMSNPTTPSSKISSSSSSPNRFGISGPSLSSYKGMARGVNENTLVLDDQRVVSCLFNRCRDLESASKKTESMTNKKLRVEIDNLLAQSDSKENLLKEQLDEISAMKQCHERELRMKSLQVEEVRLELDQLHIKHNEDLQELNQEMRKRLESSNEQLQAAMTQVTLLTKAIADESKERELLAKLSIEKEEEILLLKRLHDKKIRELASQLEALATSSMNRLVEEMEEVEITRATQFRSMSNRLADAEAIISRNATIMKSCRQSNSSLTDVISNDIL